MSMCGICWFDGRRLTDEIDDLRLRRKEDEAHYAQLKQASVNFLAAWDGSAYKPIGADSQEGRDYWAAMFDAIDKLRTVVGGE